MGATLQALGTPRPVPDWQSVDASGTEWWLSPNMSRQEPPPRQEEGAFEQELLAGLSQPHAPPLPPPPSSPPPPASLSGELQTPRGGMGGGGGEDLVGWTPQSRKGDASMAAGSVGPFDAIWDPVRVVAVHPDPMSFVISSPLWTPEVYGPTSYVQ